MFVFLIIYSPFIAERYALISSVTASILAVTSADGRSKIVLQSTMLKTYCVSFPNQNFLFFLPLWTGGISMTGCPSLQYAK